MNKTNKNWEALIKRLEKSFQTELSLKGVLYLIGVQELNMGIKEFEKEEKLDLLHIAVCKILVPFGYYKFEKIDAEGWPHYIELKAIKNLTETEQEVLMKKAIIKYLN